MQRGGLCLEKFRMMLQVAYCETKSGTFAQNLTLRGRDRQKEQQPNKQARNTKHNPRAFEQRNKDSRRTQNALIKLIPPRPIPIRLRHLLRRPRTSRTHNKRHPDLHTHDPVRSAISIQYGQVCKCVLMQIVRV